MKRRVELRIAGGTYFERLLSRDYITSRVFQSCAIELNGEFIVTCYGIDFEDDVELDDVVDYLNSMAETCCSTLTVEVKDPLESLM